MKVDKERVAVQQLDTAIRLLFNAGDVISVHTLACAAAEVLRGVLEAAGGSTWQDALIKAYPDKEQEVRRTLVRARNFFKHADRDPHEVLDFDEKTNDETIIVATLEYGELVRLGAPSRIAKLTTPMSVFQLWYFAKDPRVLTESPNNSAIEISLVASGLFPDLARMSRVEQLAKGAELLRRRERFLDMSERD